MNHMIHIAAISQIRLDTDGRAYYRRKRAEGKKPLEAIRCLIGGLSMSRLGEAPGRGSRSCRGTASLPRRADGQFECCRPRHAEAPDRR
jgi:hypothetical protein